MAVESYQDRTELVFSVTYYTEDRNRDNLTLRPSAVELPVRSPHFSHSLHLLVSLYPIDTHTFRSFKEHNRQALTDYYGDKLHNASYGHREREM